jgi:mannosylglycoprotein endo-beta-mannosidase
MNKTKKPPVLIPLFLLLFCSFTGFTQKHEILLHDNWQAIRKTDIPADGNTITLPEYRPTGWMEAIVPGTVLTTLLHNGKIPDPFIGLNNELIPDIYDTGREYYTYWFRNEFALPEMAEGRQTWLNFRGINYKADIFLNGKRVNTSPHEGMFLRTRYNITPFLNDGKNILAVIVEPPLYVGDATRGQGGDGMIARNVTMQFTAGWDWITPVRDRNTGIWDMVSLEFSGDVDIRNSYVRTRVPGARMPGESQGPAYLTFSSELSNSSGQEITGRLMVEIDGNSYSRRVTLQPGEQLTAGLPEVRFRNPAVWWPNGMGDQPLYTARFSFVPDRGDESDSEQITFGIRETGNYFDEHIRGQVFTVNGQKVFIKGGNWIASDMLLRLSAERYEAEVRMHAEMNMNMIRIWGGGLTERPDFYDACDRYGILVWQDLWMTGDCNGRWLDPVKKESQARRREYPDDHSLFLTSVEDQVKMLRNHPSLYLWCGGNEFPPPENINRALVNDIFPRLDDTRYYLEESVSADLMDNIIGGVGDGPYGILEPEWIFLNRTNPLNPEIGSIGMPNIESLRKFIPEEDLVPPTRNRVRPAWSYHKYITLGDFPQRYGEIQDVADFAFKSQIVAYEQYRSLQEGINFRMWDWYTGMLVWKNQNPWTSLRGMFYDYYLDYTGGYFGYKSAARPVHIQLNLDDSTVCVINQSLYPLHDATAEVAVYDIHGRDSHGWTTVFSAEPQSVQNLEKLRLPDTGQQVYFARLILKDSSEAVLAENFYWLSAQPGTYRQLEELRPVTLQVDQGSVSDGKLSVNVENPTDETAFFIRLKITDDNNGLLLPVFIDDNYFTLLPGEKKTCTIDLSHAGTTENAGDFFLAVEGFNVSEEKYSLK